MYCTSNKYVLIPEIISRRSGFKSMTSAHKVCTDAKYMRECARADASLWMARPVGLSVRRTHGIETIICRIGIGMRYTTYIRTYLSNSVRMYTVPSYDMYMYV